MAVGYSSFGKCFETTAEAIDNYYSSLNAFAVTLGSAPYITTPSKQAGVWKYALQNAQTGVITYTSTAAQTTVYGSCTITTDTLEGLTPANALALCTAFGVVLVTGFIFRAVAQALNHHFEGNNDE